MAKPKGLWTAFYFSSFHRLLSAPESQSTRPPVHSFDAHTRRGGILHPLSHMAGFSPVYPEIILRSVEGLLHIIRICVPIDFDIFFHTQILQLFKVLIQFAEGTHSRNEIHGFCRNMIRQQHI